MSTKPKTTWQKQQAKYGHTPPPVKEKEIDSISQTIPDQTKTIRELLDNHSRGIPSGVSELQGEYFNEPIPVFTDITEMVEYKRQLMEKNKEIQTIIRQEKKILQEKLKQVPIENVSAEATSSAENSK